MTALFTAIGGFRLRKEIKMHFWKKFLATAAMACVTAATPVLAQDSARLGKIITGYPAGGATDVVVRIVAPHLSAVTGVDYVVENRPGASGNIGAEAVVKAPPDGNTILVVFNSHSTIGPLFPNLPFDPVRDLASVGQISETPYLVVARNDIGVDDLKQLVDRAKRTNRPITLGTAGRATPQHLMAEVLATTTGAPVSAVHYKGSASAQNDLLGGHIDISLMTPSLGGALVRSGKLKLLAVTSSARIPEYPNVPTVHELGFDAWSGAGVWIAMLVPAKTPRAVVAKLNTALNDALKKSEVVAKLKSVGMNPTGRSPEQLDKIMQGERATWAAVIRDQKISVE
ncbi:tripartite tricarboxylate transporter substrate binding protein [Variovorax paradoxus]|nr:tripartite tricarboxylate transporter substrate binding protein [Variovorax paradoxus]MBT2305210.1 tripartite tricarboxylate transporter substrate binding protein [Variovorax paradoxus]